MSLERIPFGYVVGVDGPLVTLNLSDDHRGQVASHRAGVSAVAELGALFGVSSGDRLMVLKVRSLAFAEPSAAHRAGVGSSHDYSEPLRHLEATVIGIIRKEGGICRFDVDSLSSPALGAEAVPLTEPELSSLLRRHGEPKGPVILGRAVRGGGVLRVGVEDLLARHVAVLGSTGQGKTCFTAAILQQLLKFPTPRLVVFDVNGEYAQALSSHAPDTQFKHTILGQDVKIPYYALGRHGLSRLLMPSERTQRPALMFALENLDRVVTFGNDAGAALVGQSMPCLFDDCRNDGADKAHAAIERLRTRSAKPAHEWPHMRALGCLVAESHALRMGKFAIERGAFEYGNVSALVTRLNRCIEDPQFREIVDVEGGTPADGGPLNWQGEATALVNKIFGGTSEKWKVHVIDLTRVVHDLMPMILGSLLELFAFELFSRGPGRTFPTALVLEEAHHYLRRPERTPEEDSASSGLAYERLAKEGRKFGVSLWLSTQRPSEVSPTVLSQCGSWVVFRLSGETDLKAVSAANEWTDKHEVNQIPGLPKREALIFGGGAAVPTRIVAPEADPTPNSADPQFIRWLESS